MPHTSRPESRRSLPNRDLDLGYKNVTVESLVNLLLRGGLEKQFECFLEVLAGLLDRITLTGNVKLWAQGDVPVAFLLDYSGEFLGHCSPLTVFFSYYTPAAYSKSRMV